MALYSDDRTGIEFKAFRHDDGYEYLVAQYVQIWVDCYFTDEAPHVVVEYSQGRFDIGLAYLKRIARPSESLSDVQARPMLIGRHYRGAVRLVDLLRTCGDLAAEAIW